MTNDHITPAERLGEAHRMSLVGVAFVWLAVLSACTVMVLLV